MSSSETTGLVRRVGLRSATALVVANIVGAGIFTTTGFQAADLGDPRLIYALWVVGGVLAICGALCYGELGAALPQAGGEYVYLRAAYGRGLAFMSAFISLIAGFSAPIAAALKSLVRYLAHFVPWVASDRQVLGILRLDDFVALTLAWLLVVLHARGVRRGLALSDLLTAGKVIGIVGLIAAAFTFGRGRTEWVWQAAERDAGQALGPALGASLVFVMFCYSGWNASAYLAGEMRNPQSDLPRSLLGGTLLVILLYVGLNAAYFYAAGVEGLAGQVEVGLVAARQLFGGLGVSVTAAVICVSILASASAMTVAGPRVYFAFGRDFGPLSGLSRTDSKGVPVPALVLQGLVTSVIILSGRVDQIQQYSGFALTLFMSLAVSCVPVLRWRQSELPRPFRTPFYPWPALLFLAVSVWMMVQALRSRPAESILALSTVVLGGLIFLVVERTRLSSRER